MTSALALHELHDQAPQAAAGAAVELDEDDHDVFPAPLLQLFPFSAPLPRPCSLGFRQRIACVLPSPWQAHPAS